MSLITKRRRKVVVFTDLSGFTKSLREDDTYAFLYKIEKAQIAIELNIEEFDGEIVAFVGDSALLLFDTLVKAIGFLKKVRHKLSEHNILLNVGISEGEVVNFKGYTYGYCVNVASKLGEDIAQNGELLVDYSMLKEPVLPKLEKDGIAYADETSLIANFGNKDFDINP